MVCRCVGRMGILSQSRGPLLHHQPRRRLDSHLGAQSSRLIHYQPRQSRRNVSDHRRSGSLVFVQSPRRLACIHASRWLSVPFPVARVLQSLRHQRSLGYQLRQRYAPWPHKRAATRVEPPPNQLHFHHHVVRRARPKSHSQRLLQSPILDSPRHQRHLHHPDHHPRHLSRFHPLLPRLRSLTRREARTARSASASASASSSSSSSFSLPPAQRRRIGYWLIGYWLLAISVYGATM